jgi:MFS family permease
VGPRRIIACGALITATATALYATVGPSTSLWAIRSIALLLGLGMGAIGLPAQTASFATIAPQKIGRATTLFTSQQRLGSAVGVAGITTIVTAVGTTHLIHGHVQANLSSYRIGFLVASAVMFLNVPAALAINDADAAETMKLPRRKRSPEIEKRLPTDAWQAS